MSTIVSIKNIGKKYQIKDWQADPYSTLRDTITQGVRQIFNRRNRGVMQNREFWALKEVSFDIKQGERVGIIGRNGAGKSTLLKILSRITEPTTGKITLRGRVASLLEVGTGFHPELTGRENIILNGSMLGMSKQEIMGKFDEIVAFSEVERFLDTPVKRYSSGMYVRLAFAVAAHLEPEILIVDEVLAVGDVAFQRKCLGKMKDVSGEGRTVIFVSHNMEAVQKLCNTGILLQKGELIEDGPIDSIVQKYLEVYANNTSSYDIELPSNASELAGYAYQLRIEDEFAKPASEIVLGKSWQVRVSFKINKKTPHFIIALGLTTMLDMPLQTTWSFPQDLDEGNYEAVFINQDIIYTEGQYKLVIGLSSEKRVIQYKEDAGYVSISDVSAIPESEGIINTKSGIVINQMKTVISQVEG
jgi:lipopolysaccharide transport system ATP-binding protein